MSRFRPRLFFLLVCGLAVNSSTFCVGQEEEFVPTPMRTQAVIDALSPRCVAILVQYDQPGARGVGADPFESVTGLRSTGALPSRLGGGVIVKNTGGELFILTNAHLLEPAIPAVSDSSATTAPAKIYVRSEARVTWPAVIHAADPRSDLAVLKVTTQRNIQGEFQLGHAEALQRGDRIVCIGNPIALVRDGVNSVYRGTVSNQNRRPGWSATTEEDELLQSLGTMLELDLHVPVGMSGAAIVQETGELVGLTSALAQGGQFAIPMSNGMRRVVEELLNGYEVEYGFLGMSPGNSLPGELAGARPSIEQATAARVNRMGTNSPAQVAGLKVGDVILSVDGKTVYHKEDFVREISLHAPSVEVELTVWRPETRELKRLRAKLGKYPVYDDARIVATQTRQPAWRGIAVDYPTARQRYLPNRFLTDYPNGVVVSEIQTGSPASTSPLKVGQFITQVNDTVVQTPADFHAAVANLSETVKLTLHDETVIEISAN